jgi:hypothetical protein
MLRSSGVLLLALIALRVVLSEDHILLRKRESATSWSSVLTLTLLWSQSALSRRQLG